MRTITTARWIPDPMPSPESCEALIEETGMTELGVQNFNMVSVHPKKKTDWGRLMVILSAILPITTCVVCAEVLMVSPFIFAILSVASLSWNVIVLASNIRRSPR